MERAWKEDSPSVCVHRHKGHFASSVNLERLLKGEELAFSTVQDDVLGTRAEFWSYRKAAQDFRCFSTFHSLTYCPVNVFVVVVLFFRFSFQLFAFKPCPPKRPPTHKKRLKSFEAILLMCADVKFTLFNSLCFIVSHSSFILLHSVSYY